MNGIRGLSMAAWLAACAGEDPEAPCADAPLAAGDHYTEFGGLAAYVHVPDVEGCAPAVVYLHGTSGAGIWDGSAWVPPDQINLVTAADELGFVLAVPGVGTDVDDHDWNLNETGVAEVDAALLGVEEEGPVDAARAFVVGVSKGGGMASWYGLRFPAIARGIATVSGGYPRGYPEDEPDPKLPFYIAHDPNDPEVPYADAVALASDLEAHGHVSLFEDWELGDEGHGWNPDLPEPMLAFLLDPS